MRTDFLKKIGPFGAALILIISAVGIYLAFTADLGVPDRYESQHDTSYYKRNSETMNELYTELQEFVFPGLEGITGSYIPPGEKRVVVCVESEYLDRVRVVLIRDFDESLFRFETD